MIGRVDEARTRQLSPGQLAAFGVHEAPFFDSYPDLLSTAISGHFGSRDIRVLDVGGGVGRVADLLLSRHAATVTVLDNAPGELAQNRPHPGKSLVHGSALDAARLFADNRFDLILLHVVLHHLVGESRWESLANIRSVLCQCRALLAENGRISVWENIYEGWVDGLAARLIYEMTSSQLLAGLARRLGSNSAGVGISCLSAQAWHRTFAACGLAVESTVRTRDTGPFGYKRILLGLRAGYSVHFWLR